jgi:hypothetical protein
MYPHWYQVRKCVGILAWRLLGYDDDGMEMYFTHPPETGPAEVRQRKRKKKEELKPFKEALKNATPAKREGTDTNMQPILDHYMNEYLRSTSTLSPTGKPIKKKTIIVLTDGAWSGMHDEHLVDKCIRGKLDALVDQYTPTAQERRTPNESRKAIRKEAIKLLENDRPVTIQFIRFGHHPKGVPRLQRLDDDMAKQEPYYP